MPMFRERTFAAGEGRLRGPAPVQGGASYESSAGRWHTDFAARWSQTLGDVDLGVGGFYGTSREPYLLPSTIDGGFAPVGGFAFVVGPTLAKILATHV